MKNLVLILTLAFLLGACARTRPILKTTDSSDGALPAGVSGSALKPVSGSRPGPVARHWQKYDGRKKYVRNGHCVMLVLDAVPSLGNTVNWARGEHVYGNNELEPGTPIATFEPSGRYGNFRRGRSHAALYLRQDEAGIYVIDQWRPTKKSRGQKPRQRFIPWQVASKTSPANQAISYYVINRLDRVELGSASE